MFHSYELWKFAQPRLSCIHEIEIINRTSYFSIKSCICVIIISFVIAYQFVLHLQLPTSSSSSSASFSATSFDICYYHWQTYYFFALLINFIVRIDFLLSWKNLSRRSENSARTIPSATGQLTKISSIDTYTQPNRLPDEFNRKMCQSYLVVCFYYTV